MKKALIISLIILAGIIGFRLLRLLLTAQNFEINNIPAKIISEAISSFGWPKFGFNQGVGMIHELPLQSTPLKGEDEEQINILILGEGGGHHPGGNLTDAIIVGSISLRDKKATLFSIPRDLYVNIPNSDTWTKINAICSYGGVNSLKSVAQDFTGLAIHYWISLDFGQFVKIIDAVGGVTLYVEEDIYDPLFPDSNYGYEPFKLSQGWHYLDGKTALKYIRTRYTSGGDFSRTRRQQQILEALRIKLNSPKSFLNIKLISTVLGNLSGGFKTDIKFSEIGAFYLLANEVWPEFVENKIIDISESGLLVSQHHPRAGSILIPRAGIGSYGKIREWVKGFVQEDEPKAKSDW